ncbi:peptide ABC transporter substrate-binding protein [Ktedonosporobacter rubrisoli]|uniref:Peptide ABC transporter substrate-binding protein n=1 Tax=Ktedonosporobacter rubrisoli TaxID=2509675 RepID=A0A4P6JTH8_KTERU|nr:peptide ABC transporter substrate-binding protein [Ktedonosporobacter rubrisoli]QBD78889.1 peptide ABC transporter substrate-binding protein [Ktedonosporobacter rubrisoli]
MVVKSRPRPPVASFSLLAILILLLSACGASGTPIKSTGDNGKPVKGGIWIDDLANEPDSLLPNASVQTFAYMVDQALYAPLFAGDSSGKINPGIVTEMPTTANGGISSDLKTWVFHLKPNLVWSDGQPLNADDVDFTWKLWTNKKFAAASNVGYSLITGSEVSADKLSITFHLSKPYAAFPSIWTDGYHAPMPAHHFSSMAPESIKKSMDNLNPQIVSGPFMMAESKPGDHFTVQRNPKYYQAAEGLPYLDKVVFRLVANQNTILNDLKSGSIDSAWFLDVSKMKAYQALTNYQIVTNPSASVEALHYNFNNPALQDVNVRKAIAMAINPDELVKIARQDQGIVNCTDHSSAYNPGFQQDAPCPKFDIDGANKVLDQAGWSKGADGVRAKGNLRLEFQYSTTAGNPWRQEDEVLNQANLAKIGVKINIQNYPSSTFFSTFLGGGQAGKYDLAEWASSYVYDGDDAINLSCAQLAPHGSNYMFHCDQELDALFPKEQATADPAERQQIFNQIHEVMLKNFDIFGLYALKDVEITKKGTHNYQPGPFGSTETVNIWNWWCDGGKCPSGGGA